MSKRLFPILFVCLLTSGCEEKPSPPGPDGKPLPGSPKGQKIPDPRQLQDPPLAAGVLPLEDAVRNDMKDHPNDKDREFRPTVVIEVEEANPNPPPATLKKKVTVALGVKWTRLDNGSYRFTFGDPATTVTAVPTADGKAEWKTVDGKKTGEHYGLHVFFVASAGGCQDAIWVQYVKREFKFFDANGADKGTPVKGPEIDRQIPYQLQVQPKPGERAWRTRPVSPISSGPSPRTRQRMHSTW
jgi:hypothetical protein